MPHYTVHKLEFDDKGRINENFLSNTYLYNGLSEKEAIAIAKKFLPSALLETRLVGGSLVFKSKIYKSLDDIEEQEFNISSAEICKVCEPDKNEIINRINSLFGLNN